MKIAITRNSISERRLCWSYFPKLKLNTAQCRLTGFSHKFKLLEPNDDQCAQWRHWWSSDSKIEHHSDVILLAVLDRKRETLCHRISLRWQLRVQWSFFSTLSFFSQWSFTTSEFIPQVRKRQMASIDRHDGFYPLLFPLSSFPFLCFHLAKTIWFSISLVSLFFLFLLFHLMIYTRWG